MTVMTAEEDVVAEAMSICRGAAGVPGTIYKMPMVKTMPSGRKKSESGWGTCRTCRGTYRLKMNGRVNKHKPLNETSERNQRMNNRIWRKWSAYSEIVVPPAMRNNVAFQPQQVNQRLDLIQAGGNYYNVGAHAQFTVTGNQYMYAQVQTQTVGAYAYGYQQQPTYYYNFNNTTFSYNTPTVTLMTDHISWTAWNQGITVSNQTRVVTGAIWQQWIGVRVPQPAPAAPRRMEDADQIYRAAEALFARVEAEGGAPAEAQARATSTLLGLLTQAQRDEYVARRRFHIRGSRGTLYRIQHGSSGNIREVLSEEDETRGLHAYCAHPEMGITDDSGRRIGRLPHEDAMIAQMLHLMADEEDFLRVAVRHW